MPNTVSAIGGECGVKFEVPASGDSTRWCGGRGTAHTDGSGRDMKAVDEEWLERIGRMGRRAFKYEHGEREKKEKRLAARKKKKQTKIKKCMQKQKGRMAWPGRVG